MEILRFICIAFVFISQTKTCICRDHRYNPSNDFLLHEAGTIPSNDKNSYNLNFPSLSPSKPTQTTLTANINNVPATKPQTSGKRDYVAPQRPSTLPTSTSKPPINTFTNSGSSSHTPKRDYVAEFPTLKPIGTTSKHSITTPMPSTPPKRDYVAPNLPSSNNKNTNSMTGKVKDLINFYDSKHPSGPTQKPSYSSVINGPKGNQTPTLSTVNTPKPMSFSSVVSGSNKPTSTYKVTTPATAGGRPGVANNNAPTKRPGSPVLPSSIISNQGQGTNSNNPSDAELQTMSEELLRKDINNAAKYVTVNYQEKTTSLSKEDKAPLPLLTISAEVWNMTTVQKFTPLLDNYERDTLVNEYVTSQERNEENAFMDVIMATSVFRHLMNFLKDKGYVTPDPKQQRDFIKQMWFGLYSRGKGKISSSGFEHVFVSELKNNEVSGLHNWIYFSKEELANRINYLGYLKYVELNGKGAVLKMHFNQQGVDKPVDSMFIGTSPELEMALYTLCFVTRADKDCKLKLGTKDVEIVTHNFRYRSKNYIGSAYPQI
ncbi:endoribonuclease CG2145-like [Nymphalis io]|uniref:endoribonuclease CG2145-like n=1 Tax=Inachis io TaxID=171585 RepID=UPI00216A5196|nr:endoribonuclease CG2145-like [Nymphalis io]